MGVKRKKKVIKSSDFNEDDGLSIGFLVLLIATSISVALVVWTLFKMFLTKTSSSSISNSKYDAILEHAHRLSSKYHNLTSSASSSLNVQLSQGKTLKDIIIGIAQDTDPKNLAVFCSSANEALGDYRDSVDIVLFVNIPLSHRSREILTKFNIIVIEYSLTTTIESKYRSYHPSSLRWLLYYQYFIKSNKYQEYSNVLLIDTRDSYFQLNPFKTIVPTSKKSYLYVYEGVDSLTISQCGWNGGWIRDCFDKDVLKDIGSNSIICSGVSIGSMDTVLKYLQYMHDIISGKSSENEMLTGLHAKFPTCERNGVDQGVHNTIIHKKLIPDVDIIQQIKSPILNMQAKKGVYDEIEHVVKNQLGERASIVHQYDRMSSLQDYLFQKYVNWVDTSDVDALWLEEEACQSFNREDNKDLFKGICDFKMQGGASTATTCCKICNEYESNCRAFTFYSGICYLKDCSKASNDPNSNLIGAVSAYRVTV